VRLKLSTALLLGLLALALVSVREARSVASSPLATVSGTLNPGETADYGYTIAKDLDDCLLHVRVDAKAPETDRLDITIEGATWTDLQGDWWDAWGAYANDFGPLTAGDHILTATTSTDAVNQVTFTVEFYEIPAPPFTVEGRFAAEAPEFGMGIAYIHINLPEAGEYPISANVNEGSYAVVFEAHDPIEVLGPTKRTLKFDEAGVWEFQVQADLLGKGEATAWSITVGSATSIPSLNVKISEGCEGVGPGLSCVFHAEASANDGSQPDIQYNWTTTGGCFVTETSECVSTILGQSANWTAPGSSSEVTYRVTVEATASGYDSGMDSWPVVVPEFSLGSLAPVVLIVLTTTFVLTRKRRHSK